MTVAFAPPHAVFGPDRRKLWFEGNGKITAGNGSFDAPGANSFSLIHVADCPGSTPTCRASCYVHGLEANEPAVHALYRENSATIREILELPYTAVRSWATRVAEYVTEFAPGGFRWHVSGDIFSPAYAFFIADVCRDSPTVPHWIYTRSFAMARPLASLDNLALNFSCDQDNYRKAVFHRADFRIGSGVAPRLCYLSAGGEVPHDLPAGSVLFPDYSLRSRDGESEFWRTLPAHHRKMICPVDMFGPSRSSRCGVCKKCF